MRVVRSIASIVAAAAVTALPVAARAQVFYSYPGARPVSDASPALGATAGFGDHLVQLLGFARFNASPVSDLGVEGVFQSVDAGDGGSDIGYGGVGVDYRYQFLEAGDTYPVDVCAQGGGGFVARSRFLDIRVPFGAMASRDFVLRDGRHIVPYGGLYVVIDHERVDVPGFGNHSHTDGSLELRFGASAEIVRRGSVFAALHVGNGTMFFLGFNAGL
jgi:hypothetical protein